jgi:hypothetical protein
MASKVRGGGGVRVRVQIKDVDKGYRDRMKQIDAAKSASIEVGIMGDEGGLSQKKGGPGLTVLDVATFHEFGLGVPERSFIRGWFDVYQATARKQISAMLQSVVAGRRSKSQMMELLGVRWVAEIQKFIAAGTNLQPLEEVTILRKGSSVPLVDTGQLKASVTYRIVLT